MKQPTARKVVTRSGRRVRGYFPSTKAAAMVPWESLLERDAILLFEFSPGVLKFQAQPEQVLYYRGSEQHSYYPDFKLELIRRPLNHAEVKYEADLIKPSMQEKYSGIADHYRQHRAEQFLILTDRIIRRRPLLDNLQRLAYCRPRLGSPSITQLASQYLEAGDSISIGELRNKLVIPNAVYRLLAEGLLHCDLTLPLNDDTLLTRPIEGATHDALFF